MKKTLAQLKKDIAVGREIECINFTWAGRSDFVPEKMRGARIVRGKNTVGFTLSKDGDAEASHFEWPKATELEYVDNTITVTPRGADGEVFQTRVYRIIL